MNLKDLEKHFPPERNGKLNEDIEWQPRVDDYQFGYNTARQDCISALPKILEEIKREILEGVENYKVAKEMTKINKLGADYIYVYDLKTFVLSLLSQDKEEQHICCDGECSHDDCCGKIPENCPLLNKEETL